jgi:hypothetical protein
VTVHRIVIRAERLPEALVAVRSPPASCRVSTPSRSVRRSTVPRATVLPLPRSISRTCTSRWRLEQVWRVDAELRDGALRVDWLGAR